MKRVLCCFLLSTVALLADVTGKWSGSFDITGPDGQSRADTAFLDLKEDSGNITGTGGPNAEQQSAISKGKIDGNKITFEIAHESGPLMKFELLIEGDHIKGNVKGEREGEIMTAKLDVTRVK